MEMSLAEHWLTGLSDWFQVVQGWCPANPGQQVPDVERAPQWCAGAGDPGGQQGGPGTL